MVDPVYYVKTFFRSVFSVFSPSTTTVWANSIAYSITLHNPRVHLYRGAETYVTFSIYAQAYSAEARKQLEALSTGDLSAVVRGTNVQLVQKGWIAGAVGWNAAGYLGVGTKTGWDVTPVGRAAWADAQAEAQGLSARQQEDEDWGEKPHRASADEYEMQPLTKTSSQPELKETRHIALKRKEKIDKQIRAQSSTVADTAATSATRVLGTFKCRIPVSTGDGYFRLYATFPSPLASRTTIGIGSPTFRLFSLSLTSASPRGAALLPIPVIVPELALRLVSIALTTLVYGLFPVAAIIDKLLPRWMSRRFVNWIYARVGAKGKAEQLKQRYGVDRRVEQAREQVKRVPFASAGIRTEWDLERDAKRGRGGWAYHW